MKKHCKLKKSDYARGWGKMWAQYERQYEFSQEVKAKVKHRMARHPEIVRWYQLYKIKAWLK